MKKRRVKRYRGRKQNSGVKFLAFIAIMVSAVICGYLTARFVVAPLLGYDTEVLKLDFPSKLTSLVQVNGEKGSDGNVETQDNGYVLQFGVFSSQSGAEELANGLRADGIEVEVQEVDLQYKVVSKSYPTKEDALKQLESLKKKKNIDVFITIIS